jgi:hypothetical protein
MSTIAFDQFALTRIADFARSLSRLHRASRRRIVDDDQIDREFNAVCMSVWGYTTDDFSDDLFSGEDHAFLDTLDEAHARIFAAEQGYDLVDDQGMLTDWWGYCWMILAEKRGLLTAENRAAARAAIEEKYLTAPNVIRRHRRAVSVPLKPIAGSATARGPCCGNPVARVWIRNTAKLGSSCSMNDILSIDHRQLRVF